MIHKLKLKKGDKVVITTGKDKGFTGEITKVMPKANKVIVANANVFYKHTKASKESEGGIIKKEMPIHISNLAILDPKEHKATKVGFKFLEDGSKVRYAKLSGEILSKERSK